MSSYSDLAKEYILNEDQAARRRTASTTAARLQDSPSQSVSWVESISPWMTDVDDEDPGKEVDLIARSHAIEFLAATLEAIGSHTSIFSLQQVTVITAFFFGMYRTDFGAGLLPVTKALGTLVHMKNFSANQAPDIIDSICCLDERFKRQHPATRLELYSLLDYLMFSSPSSEILVASWGEQCIGMQMLLPLFRQERDPACLMKWFSIIQKFPAAYKPALKILGDVFEVFTQYFPVSLKSSQIPGVVSTDELKCELRKCFGAHPYIANLGVTFLISKLDQGPGAQPAVKIDVLRTLDHCLAYLGEPSQTLSLAKSIWSNLKYEVRNGEDVDAVDAALRIIRRLPRWLSGDDLRDFLASVMSDCNDDLATPIYTAPTSKLLVTVMSAQSSSFYWLAPRVLSCAKSHIRRSESPMHTEAIISLLNSILALRLALCRKNRRTGLEIAHSTGDFLTPLYLDPYSVLLDQHLREGILEADNTIVRKVIEGLSLLVMQPKFEQADDRQDILLDSSACETICLRLTQFITTDMWKSESASLVADTVIALSKINTVFEPALHLFVSSVSDSVSDIQTLKLVLPIMASIGCMETSMTDFGLNHFVFTISRLFVGLRMALNGSLTPDYWCEYATGILNSMCYFGGTHLLSVGSRNISTAWSWNDAVRKYPPLASISLQGDAADSSFFACDSHGEAAIPTIPDIMDQFLTICLHAVRQLIRRATQFHLNEETDQIAVHLSPDFKGLTSMTEYENKYLTILSLMAKMTVRMFTSDCKVRLGLPQQISLLFQATEEFGTCCVQSQYNDPEQCSIASVWKLPHLSVGREIILSSGILEGVDPVGLKSLGPRGCLEDIFLTCLSTVGETHEWPVRFTTQAMLANIANKYEIEGAVEIMRSFKSQVEIAIGQDSLASDRIQIVLTENVMATMAGIVRRWERDTPLPFLLELVHAPCHPRIGQHLGRRFERIIAPLIDEENSSTVALHLLTIVPAWKENIYRHLAKPMLGLAVPDPDMNPAEQRYCSNYRIAVVSVVRWMGYSLYQEDAQTLMRISLCILNDLPKSRDVTAAFIILRNVVEHGPDEAQEFISSIINACRHSLSRVTHTPPGWMPDDYVDASTIGSCQADCDNLALELLEMLPKKYTPQQLLFPKSAPMIMRLLAERSGDGSRNFRLIARRARASWSLLSALR